METSTLLRVDEHPISSKQALAYLQSAGKLGTFVKEILRQYVLEQELQTRNITVNAVVLEQAVIDFRLEQQLTEPNQFQQWLVNNGIDYETFHQQLAFSFKLTKLIDEITEPKLQESFIEKKIYLDRIVLSRIIVDTEELAEELKSQIEEEEERFEHLAQAHSLTDDCIVNGMMGPISRGQLPDEVRSALDRAAPGDLVGPLKVEERWGLFRVEQLLPASLADEQLKAALKNELFEQWFAEKMPVKVELQ